MDRHRTEAGRPNEKPNDGGRARNGAAADTLGRVRAVATRAIPVPIRRAIPVSVVSLLLIGCTSTGDDDAPDTTSAIAADVPEVTSPPERQTPFCQAMLDLDAALPGDPAVDTRDQVLAAYQAALSVVPTDIEVEFRAVIEALESGTRATVPGDASGDVTGDASDGAGATVAPATAAPGPPDEPGVTLATVDTSPPSDEQLFAEEGWLPDDDPAIRVNEYVEFACRDTINNPGPPATVPDAVPPASEAG
jgi:hypothetical protein